MGHPQPDAVRAGQHQQHARSPTSWHRPSTPSPAPTRTLSPINFTATTTRYVRIRITANTAWPAGQLSEIEVYGGSAPPPDTTPPTVPGTLSYTQSGTSISLSWGASTDSGGSGLAGYDVYRNGILASSVSAGTTTYTDTQPTTATVSYYVRARDGVGNASGNSNTVTRTGTTPDTTAPTVPGTLSYTQSGTSISLSWGASTDSGGSGLAGYDVYRDGTLATTVAAGTTTFTDTQAVTATVSYYVKARDGAGNTSAASNTVTRTGTAPDTTPPTTPGTLSQVTSGTSINLSWGASTDTGGSGLAGYNVYRDGTLVATLGTVLTYTDTQPATATVSYYVRARDGAGNLSGNSNTVTRTGTQPPGCTNVAAGKPVTATGSTFTFMPSNATDGSVTTYWEGSATYPQNLTVALGSNQIITAVNVKLNPDASWGTRTQNFQILGRDQASGTYTNLVSAATYTFTQGTNVVNIPVSATTADVRLTFNSQHRRPVGPGRRARGLRHPGTEPGPGRHLRDLDPDDAERGQRDHVVGHRAEQRHCGLGRHDGQLQPGRCRGRQRRRRCARRRRLDHRLARPGDAADGQLPADRRSSTRRTRSSSRTTPTTASPRRRRSSSRRRRARICRC